jgi:hypothetical protein
MEVVNDILAAADPNVILGAATVLLATLIYGECGEMRWRFSLEDPYVLGNSWLVVCTGIPKIMNPHVTNYFIFSTSAAPPFFFMTFNW